MPRILTTDTNVFALPAGAVVDKRGFVYVNTSSEYGTRKDGKGKYSTHKKKCVGKAVPLESGGRPTHLYANRAYFSLLKKESLPEPPSRPDTISVGLHAIARAVDEQYGLSDMLAESFGPDSACLVMDLACYMVSEESAIFQHFPKWARNHALFSPEPISDSLISAFLKDQLTVSRIEQFKQNWARANPGSGRVYFCYDSTNTNSQAEGVFLVEKGHAKDNPDLRQVNTDYVVRQEDGVPLTFKEFPGSINDMAEAAEMIDFLKKLTDQNLKIVLVCDRGYISGPNVQELDDAGIGFLMLLRSNLVDNRRMISELGAQIKEHQECFIEDFDVYGATHKGKLFGGQKDRYYHLIWSPSLAETNRRTLRNNLAEQEAQLRKAVQRQTSFVENELRRFSWFKLDLQATGSQVPYKGRGRRKAPVDTDTFVIKGFERDYEAINNDIQCCGFYVIVTSDEMSAAEAYREYHKRDCVEKVFRALKSSLGMDCIGVHTAGAIVGKALVWFVASILRSALFLKLASLRKEDRKGFTVPAALDLLDEISAYKDLNTGKYERRYSFTAKQKKILRAVGVKEDSIDALIAGL